MNRYPLHGNVHENVEKGILEEEKTDMNDYPVQRDLDGVYYRQKRDGKWTNVCFTDMTDEEQSAVLEKYDVRQLTRMAYLMADVVKTIDEEMQPSDKEWEAMLNECNIDSDTMNDIVYIFAGIARVFGDVLNIAKE